MRVMKKTQKLVEAEELSHVVCNVCGNVMTTRCASEGNGSHVKFVGCYDSSFFGDLTIVEFDVCEECLYKWSKTFKIPPDGWYYNVSTGDRVEAIPPEKLYDEEEEYAAEDD